MDKVDENISKWSTMFDEYLEIDNNSTILLGKINEVKNNIKKIIGKQNMDDIMFYKSMLENSHFYLSNSLKIRKIKFQKDLTNIYNIIDSTKKFDDISKPNFLLLLKDYRKIVDEYYLTKKNSSTLAWIKDEKLNNFNDIEKDMLETMNYHITLMTVMNCVIKVEQQYYCGE
jgi:hypothetical protein